MARRAECQPDVTRPRLDSVESWARHYVETTDLSSKLEPPAPPQRWEPTPAPQRLVRPGRPPELRPARRGYARVADLRPAGARAKLLHAFFHHELQAAELACWALLAFCDAEAEFRSGLLRLCLDEIRHLNGYRRLIERLGYRVGDFAIRDWFWQRVPSCPSPVHFVALMGMGLEGANLEHASEFEERFRAVGDSAAADFQARVAREEIGHVRFAVSWFQRWTGGQDFDRWRRALPFPLTPMLMRGKRVDPVARRAAGMSGEFIAALSKYRA